MTYTYNPSFYTMNDAVLAQKYIEMRNKMKIANLKYKSTAKGKAKSAENQRNYYKTHSNNEGFKEKRRETANSFYATNETYRLNRQEKARQRYYYRKYGPPSEIDNPPTISSPNTI